MNNEAQKKFIESLTDGEMLDNIFGYAYKRCFSKYEAEDLCQEIITEILLALQNGGDITNFNAYIWQIAHNTYIDHINRQKRANRVFDPTVNINANYSIDMEDDIIERIVDADNLSRIKKEIAILPEIYKNVMIMHYLDGLSVAEIADSLNIPENRVKQRLFAARNKIRKEVLDMSTNPIIKPEQPKKLYDLSPVWMGGDLFKYDTRDKISSSLIRKNIIISCRKEAKTIQELSNEFCVPFAIIEDEIKQIPEDFIKKTDKKYIANSIVIDLDLQKEIDKFIADIAKDYFKEVKEYLLSKKDEIMKLPFINPPKSFEHLLWWYLPQFADTVKWSVDIKINEMIADHAVEEQEERKAYIICNIIDPDEKEFISKGKNHNGIWNVFNMLGKHEEVRINNLAFDKYLTWEKGRFFAGQDFSHFPELAMVFKTTDGLDVDSVAETDKEATATALEKSYIRKEGGKLYPNVIVAPENVLNWLNWYKWGYDQAGNPNKIMSEAKWYAGKIAVKLWEFAYNCLPKHLLSQIKIFASSINWLEYYLMEEGVKDGILYELPETGCTEGIFASIHYQKFGVEYTQPAKGEIFIAKIEKINKDSLAEKIGVEIGDIIAAVNGVDWNDYCKEKEKELIRKGFWNNGDVITVDRNGEKIDFTVVFE